MGFRWFSWFLVGRIPYRVVEKPGHSHANFLWNRKRMKGFCHVTDRWRRLVMRTWWSQVRRPWAVRMLRTLPIWRSTWSLHSVTFWLRHLEATSTSALVSRVYTERVALRRRTSTHGSACRCASTRTHLDITCMLVDARESASTRVDARQRFRKSNKFDFDATLCDATPRYAFGVNAHYL